MFTINDFNPRSHEGSDGGTERGKSRKYNFNPRSHEGSDMILPCVRIVPLISIHAPTRGATVIGVHFSIICIISIHAPTRGATLTSAKRYRIFVFQSTLPRGERPETEKELHAYEYNFNPRSHEGSDQPSEDTHPVEHISIHAPTRGATSFTTSYSSLSKFQSTLPRGERLWKTCSFPFRLYFNPRSHEGSDAWCRSCYSHNQISIHAPTRGATMGSFIPYLISKFQSTLPRGERRFLIMFAACIICVFQSTLPRGERLLGSVWSFVQ